ncbi:MAG: hypothetical protein JJE28_04135, partial [Actinomycetales bacterium]|nr:hypothetical protein [Actinomycetales bacterium]
PPDNAPLLGRVRRRVRGANGEASAPIPGLLIATGFFRHGVLLMPVAAQICADLLDGVTDPRWEPFAPDRFSPTSASQSIESPSTTAKAAAL